ncbi:unnamed protein product, partial [Vitis vinifera]|uniref:Uncharacterized protein n=1 Tax=Vitis vinifera TaxID=29760 RepID=D7SNS4_VITVI
MTTSSSLLAKVEVASLLHEIDSASGDCEAEFPRENHCMHSSAHAKDDHSWDLLEIAMLACCCSVHRHGPFPWLRAKLIHRDKEQLMPGFHHWIPGRSPYHFGSNKRISLIRSKDARTQNLIPEHVGNHSLLRHDFHPSRISTILLGFIIQLSMELMWSVQTMGKVRSHCLNLLITLMHAIMPWQMEIPPLTSMVYLSQ